MVGGIRSNLQCAMRCASCAGALPVSGGHIELHMMMVLVYFQCNVSVP